ncbi:MAG TPA: transporter, partial [Thermodesulfobacteriota bacterium]|nr:transporter [Thermodesulfobacteriota bacterium]
LGGEIERDMQPGFGSPSYTLGISAMQPLSRNFSLVAETSYQLFTEKDNYKFGNEWKLNAAGVYELYGKAGGFLQTLNGILELNLLNLARDSENGQSARASGGTILYLSPGLRFSFPKLQNANLGLMVKFPVWKNLNEESEQQGSEGLEKYRLVLTLSFFF